MTVLTTLSLNEMITEALTNLEEIGFGRGSAMVDFNKKDVYVKLELSKECKYTGEHNKGFYSVTVEVEGVKILDGITQYISNNSGTRVTIIEAVEKEMKFQNKK